MKYDVIAPEQDQITVRLGDESFDVGHEIVLWDERHVVVVTRDERVGVSVRSVEAMKDGDAQRPITETTKAFEIAVQLEGTIPAETDNGRLHVH
jgi:hypothetical protein